MNFIEKKKKEFEEQFECQNFVCEEHHIKMFNFLEATVKEAVEYYEKELESYDSPLAFFRFNNPSNHCFFCHMDDELEAHACAPIFQHCINCHKNLDIHSHQIEHRFISLGTCKECGDNGKVCNVCKPPQTFDERHQEIIKKMGL